MFVPAAPVSIRLILFLLAATLFFSACKTVKNPPTNRPFVYETNVVLKEPFTRADRKTLIPQLQQQLHDSTKARWVKKFIFFQVLKNPPAFDSLNAVKSVIFIRGLLNALGYYRDSIRFDTSLRVRNGQQQTTLTFTVESARLFHIDSIAYNLRTDTSGTVSDSPLRDTLQQLTEATMRESLVKKGDPFSSPLLSQEISRLSELYRDNGYLNFTSSEMLVLWDTVGLALLRPTLDPIEQARQLDLLRRRRLNPTADIEFRLKTAEDSTLYRYRIGKVRVYPDLTEDAEKYYPTYDTIGSLVFISYPYLFNPQKLKDYVYLHPGDLYRQSNVLKTQNKFNSFLPSWKLVSILPIKHPGTDTVDFDIRLTPARKYQFSANLEGSRNQTALVTGGNLLGLGANVSVQNRNFARGANLSTWNFRYGIELNGATDQNTIQTQQFALGNTIIFPRKVPAWHPLFRNSKENIRTIFGLNLAYTDRIDYYTVQSVNTSWTVEKSFKNALISFRFPNIEYYYLNRQDSLRKLIEKNQSYKYIFNKGLILSTIFNLSLAKVRPSFTRLLLFSAETSGALARILHSDFLDSNLNKFLRFDVEYRKTYRIRRSAIAFRLFGGVGISTPSSSLDSLNLYLPFFRQYFAGGPNSMRAWNIRRLGPGSTIKSFASTDAPDRFGDMRLEANLEYRFFIGDAGGVVFNGALFTDVGNVWFLRPNPDFPDGEFRLDKLGKDLAIGAGTGLRVDFSFLKLRFDYAYKVKDPTPADASEQNRWFYNWQLLNGQFQIGIDYPF